YGDTTFNYMDYIRARDYRGGNITDKVKVYGKVDVNQKGVYRLRCTVISYFNLACTKYINIIVE
ncbi:MAG: chitinase, partial [Eubacterium ventriosum]|nr:chitinase [Eubacterium ventriosum]